MINYPTMQFKNRQATRKKARTIITEFRGINHTPTCGVGEWYEANNVSNIEYPMLTTHGDRAGVDELDGYPVPERYVLGFCASEPPSYLDSAGHLLCGGEEVVLSTTTSLAWAAKCTTIQDLSEAEPEFSVTDAGVADLVTLLGLSGGHGTVSFGCLTDQDEEPDNSLWIAVDGDYTVLDSNFLLSKYGITRTSAIGAARGGDEAFSVDLQEVVLNELTGPRQMVQMGAYVLVWPDKWYCNVVKLASGLTMVQGTDYGSMSLNNSAAASDSSPVYTMLCHLDGTPYNTYNSKPAGMTANGRVYYGKDEPHNPNNYAFAAGDLWMTVDSDYNVLEARTWDTDMGWMPTTDYGVMLYGTGIAAGVREGYYVTVSGWNGTGANKMERACVNKEHPVIGVDPSGNWLILGDCFITGSGTMIMTSGSGTVAVSLDIPDMDYVVECGNRLWGCYYGDDGSGNVLNEIYGSALGDFRSWKQFQGLSTDSWTASRGSPGPYTGAVVYGGNPLFFKADCLEKVFPSTTGAHQIQTISLDGVQAGCGKSLAVIDDRLYYKSPLGVCVYTGTLPQQIGYKLGPEAAEYGLATAGRSGKRYVLDMQGDSARRLYVYDTDSGYWQEEDPVYTYLYENEANVPMMVTYDEELYATKDGKLLQLVRNAGFESGTEVRPIPRPNKPTTRVEKEGAAWYAVTANLGVETGQRKYVSRIRIRAKMYAGNYFRVYVSYNDGETWEKKYSKETLWEEHEPRLICLFPRRCDRFRLKFEGAGRFELQMIQWDTETGSDV